MSRYGEHTPTIYEPMWNKIAQLSGINPADVKQMSIFIREAMLAQMLFYWPEIQKLISGKQQVIPTPVEEYGVPELTEPAQAPRIDPLAAFVEQQIPGLRVPVPVEPPVYLGALPPIPEDQMWKPAEYTPPPNEDPGKDIQLEFGPEICWQCRPKQEIKHGEWANVRTGRYGKEYRHSSHCWPQRIEPLQPPMPPPY